MLCWAPLEVLPDRSVRYPLEAGAVPGKLRAHALRRARLRAGRGLGKQTAGLAVDRLSASRKPRGVHGSLRSREHAVPLGFVTAMCSLVPEWQCFLGRT